MYPGGSIPEVRAQCPASTLAASGPSCLCFPSQDPWQARLHLSVCACTRALRDTELIFLRPLCSGESATLKTTWSSALSDEGGLGVGCAQERSELVLKPALPAPSPYLALSLVLTTTTLLSVFCPLSHL